jgi:hypothetical protein
MGPPGARWAGEDGDRVLGGPGGTVVAGVDPPGIGAGVELPGVGRRIGRPPTDVPHDPQMAWPLPTVLPHAVHVRVTGRGP